MIADAADYGVEGVGFGIIVIIVVVGCVIFEGGGWKDGHVLDHRCNLWCVCAGDDCGGCSLVCMEYILFAGCRSMGQ